MIKLDDVLKKSSTGWIYLDFLGVLLTAKVKQPILCYLLKSACVHVDVVCFSSFTVFYRLKMVRDLPILRSGMKWTHFCLRDTTSLPMVCVHVVWSSVCVFVSCAGVCVPCCVAVGLMWTLYLLAKHPNYQEKCREVRSVLQGREQLE